MKKMKVFFQLIIILFLNANDVSAQMKAIYFGELINGQGKKITHEVVPFWFTLFLVLNIH